MSVDSREDGAEVRIQLTEMPGGIERAGLRARFGRLLTWIRRRWALTLAYRKEAWDGFRLGLPAALVLLALSAIIAHFKLLAPLDAWMTGDIAARRSGLEASLVRGPELQIQQLEIAASARVAQLEQKKNVVVASEVARVGGVAPIDRAEMATALVHVARGLAKTAAERKHPAIVAIDVDLAPLGQGATPPTAVEAMHGAITELRQYAHVIAVVLPRSEVASRLERNAFMTQAECTRQLGNRASEMPSGNPVQATPPYGLYFASARLFHRAGEPPLEFPYALKRCDDDDALPVFPSLGTLIHLRHGTQAGPSCGRPWDRLIRRPTDAPPPRQRTLTALCEQAHGAQGTGSDGMLLEDVFSEKKQADTLLEPYRQLLFNWRLLDSTQLVYTIVPTVQELESAVEFATVPAPAASDAGPPPPKVLLLGIDGGERHDKFDIAGVSPEPVSGAALHGLQALSVGTVLSGSAWLGLAYDVAVGLLFAIFWALLSPLLSRWRGAMPTLGGWVTALAPAGLAFLFIWGSMYAAAWLLETDLWLNPAYLILGLALDAYLEGWRQARANESKEDPKAHPAQAGRWYLFGADIALNSLRRGYGARVHWVDIFLATGQGELLASGAARYEGSRGWEMADKVLSALLRVTVLVVGLSLVGHQLWKG